MTVYLVVHDVDPGYARLRILGAYSTREAADKRIADLGASDTEVIELTLDEDADDGS